MSDEITKPKPAENYSSIEAKWGKELAGAGWTPIPSVIFEHQHALGLDATDLVIILQIAKYWWTAGNDPYPSKRSIAEAMGLDPRNVQRRIARLVKDGLIEKKANYRSDGGNRGNLYTFNGLIKAATEFAKAKLEQMEARKKTNAEMRRRKKPMRLRVVKSEP